MLGQERYPIQDLFALEPWLQSNEGNLTPEQYGIHVLNERELSQITQLKTPNQVLAVAAIPGQGEEVDWSNGWTIYLDGIQDPGNLGTILRISDWFGIRKVVAGPGTVELYNSKTIQATMGAFLRVQYLEMDLSDIASQAPSVPILAADMHGESIYDVSFPETGILVIGNEGRGLSQSSIDRANKRISIPPATQNGTESLNAAVATGIICAFLRRRY